MLRSLLPDVLNFEAEDDVLVPIRIDINDTNGRYLDNFCWNIYNSPLTPEEFAWKTCMEENMPSEFIPRIATQIAEQVDSYHAFLDLVVSSSSNEATIDYLRSMVADVTIRSSVVEYSDSFQWDAYRPLCNPEDFAKQTCFDLGLPSEMQPAIAFRLREILIRSLLDLLEKANLLEKPASVSDMVSNIKIRLLQPNVVVEQISETWRQSLIADVPKDTGASYYSENKQTNACNWV